MAEHTYPVNLRWTGNTGSGTSGYRDFQRTHEIRVPGKPRLLGSSDPTFRGDADRYNPEELLVASLSACHMLWYLHLAASANVTVVQYSDDAVGTMIENADGSGQFADVLLRPGVRIVDPATKSTAEHLHERAHRMCFIARSVNFPVRCQPTVETG